MRLLTELQFCPTSSKTTPKSLVFGVIFISKQSFREPKTLES